MPPMFDEQTLRCPATHSRLRRDGPALVSEDGSRRYPIVRGVPVLIDEERSLFRLADFTPGGPRARRRSCAAARVRSSRATPTTPAPSGSSHACASCCRQRPRVLVVGGGTLGAGLGPLLDDPAVDATETDVWIGPRTVLVCDGARPPVRRRGVRRRRLPGGARARARPAARRGGDAPRARARRAALRRDPVHAAGPRGRLRPHALHVRRAPAAVPRLRRARRRRGLRAGDGARVVAPLLSPSTAGRRWARSLVPLFTFWLPWLDRWLIHRPAALDAASSIAFLGRRRDAPVPDADVVARLPRRQRDAEPLVRPARAVDGTPELQATAQEADAPGEVHRREHERQRRGVGRGAPARAGAGRRQRGA